MRGQKTRILLANYQNMVRQGIRRLLEQEVDFEVIGETDNALDAVSLAGELKPDVIIMEARLPKLSVVEAIRRIKAKFPKACVMILTTLDNEEYVVSLIGAGADGYLLKDAPGNELVQAIRLVQAGEFVSDPVVMQKLYKRATRRVVAVNSVEHLTHRELEILKLATKGMSTRDISDELGIGLRTVKGHFEAIFSKTGVRSRIEAVLMALKQGWVSLQDE